MYKFNGGRGAVICDVCRIIIDEDLGLKEYEEIYEKVNPDGDICTKCFSGKKVEKKKISGIIDDGWRN